MVEHAEACGVSLHWNTPARLSDLDRVGWVIGADGVTSAVRRAAGLDRGRSTSRRFGFRRHFRITPWTDFVEVYWSHRAQAYITPVNDHETGIALIADDASTRYSDLFRIFPDLAARIGNADPVSTLRGAITMSRRFARVTGGNVALVGDASGSVDAITGEGFVWRLNRRSRLPMLCQSIGLRTTKPRTRASCEFRGSWLACCSPWIVMIGFAEEQSQRWWLSRTNSHACSRCMWVRSRLSTPGALTSPSHAASWPREVVSFDRAWVRFRRRHDF